MTGPAYRIAACGDDALRILCGPGVIRHQIARALKADTRWTDVVPGKEDVSVAFDLHTAGMDAARMWILDALTGMGTSAPEAGRSWELDAEFGGDAGPDLAPLAERLGMGRRDIVAAVERSLLTVDMLGFTPGFAYLTGLASELTAQRLFHPRARVAAGSIGLITGQVGLYALSGPGGWPIIGRVQTPLFERSQADPFKLQPGDRVTLRAVKPE